MAAINGISQEEIRLRAAQIAAQRMAAQTKGVEGTSAQPVSTAATRTPSVGTGEPINYQVGLTELARKYGSEKTEVNPAVSAAAGSVSVPVQSVSQPQVSKVDSTTAINHINGGTKTEISSALRGIGASAAYAKTANTNSGNDAFAPLKNVKINETTIAKTTTNPFANLANNNGSNYTQGLSFAGVNDLNNLRYMEIA